MKRKLTLGLQLAVALLVTTKLSAQITITDADVASAGTSLIMATADTVLVPTPVGGSGNQTWNFTTLGFDYLDTLTFGTPASVGLGNPYPNANLAMQFASTPGAFFLILNSTGLEVDGIAGVDLGLGVPASVDLSPNRKIVTFPSTMGTQFVNTSVIDTVVEDLFTGVFDSLKIRRTTISTSNFDAYGTLNTPSGSYSTIRQYLKELNIDSVWGYNALLPPPLGPWVSVQQQRDSTFNYNWFANGEGYAVMSVTTDGPGGNLTSLQFKVGPNMLGYMSQNNGVACNGDCNGSATVTAISGSGNYTYAWPASANNQTTATASNLCAGSYAVTVNDGVTTTTVNVAINAPAVLGGSIVSTTNESYLGNDGSITAGATGGTSPYLYNWSNGDGGETATGLAGGAYTVTITDANGCTTTANATLTSAVNVETLVKQTSISVFPNPAVTSITIISEGGNYALIDITGKTIQKGRIGTTAVVDVNKLNAGMYILRVESAKSIASMRLEITK